MFWKAYSSHEYAHRENWYTFGGKRAFDIAVSLLAITALLPVIVSIWLLVRVTSKGPALFTQTRNGFGFKTFTIYKFRTMVVPEGDQAFAQTTKADPRITRLGRFLRKTSLDELPQLYNVLRGEMSIVGPRPHAVEMDSALGSKIQGYDQRYLVKPGITGLAQVRGLRGAAEEIEVLDKRVSADIEYCRSVSFRRDFAICLKTLTVVFKQTNAF